MRIAHTHRIAALTAAAALALLAWDQSGADLWLARASGGPQGFALRHDWLLTEVLHDGGRRIAWALALALCLAVWWPMGWLRRLGTTQRLQLAVTTLACVAVVSALKALSGSSCPWDLEPFGGVARYASHWQQWLRSDGGGGRCFPAGQASSGFAFIGGWFAFHRTSARIARRWLAAALAAGLVFGMAQQLRGAHFMSHTLWTAWLCWTVAWLIDLGWGAEP